MWTWTAIHLVITLRGGKSVKPFKQYFRHIWNNHHKWPQKPLISAHYDKLKAPKRNFLFYSYLFCYIFMIMIRMISRYFPWTSWYDSYRLCWVLELYLRISISYDQTNWPIIPSKWLCVSVISYAQYISHARQHYQPLDKHFIIQTHLASLMLPQHITGRRNKTKESNQGRRYWVYNRNKQQIWELHDQVLFSSKNLNRPK